MQLNRVVGSRGDPRRSFELLQILLPKRALHIATAVPPRITYASRGLSKLLAPLKGPRATVLYCYDEQGRSFLFIVGAKSLKRSWKDRKKTQGES